MFRDQRSAEWAQKVKERDNYTCQLCGMKNVFLHSHHLYAWKFFENFRYDLDNGLTLCVRCHSAFHLYKSGICTIYDFLSFKKTINAFKKALSK